MKKLLALVILVVASLGLSVIPAQAADPVPVQPPVVVSLTVTHSPAVVQVGDVVTFSVAGGEGLWKIGKITFRTVGGKTNNLAQLGATYDDTFTWTADAFAATKPYVTFSVSVVVSDPTTHLVRTVLASDSFKVNGKVIV